MKESHNIDTVRSMYTAFLRGDTAAVLERMDESIVLLMPGSPTIPTAGTHRGLQEVERFFDIVRERLEFTTFEVKEYIAQGNRVVALIHYEGRNRQTGRGFTADSAMLWTIGNGRAIRCQEFTDTEALAKASEPNAHMFGAG
jgi:ketosteroid isomerase-like protein